MLLITAWLQVRVLPGLPIEETDLDFFSAGPGAAIRWSTQSAAPPAPDASHYWRIVTGLTLARVFFQRMPARLDAQLARLLDLLARQNRSLEALRGSADDPLS